MAALKVPFIGEEMVDVLSSMSVFERSMKQTLSYDKFLDAVYKVRLTHLAE